MSHYRLKYLDKLNTIKKKKRREKEIAQAVQTTNISVPTTKLILDLDLAIALRAYNSFNPF
jgi:hypothetical protein